MTETEILSQILTEIQTANTHLTNIENMIIGSFLFLGVIVGVLCCIAFFSKIRS